MLLQRIAEHGSISGAARSMKMSYRQAWELVNRMNQHCEEPLVHSSTGGRGGGGAQLTASGKRAIALYHEVREDFDAFLAERSRKVKI